MSGRPAQFVQSVCVALVRLTVNDANSKIDSNVATKKYLLIVETNSNIFKTIQMLFKVLLFIDKIITYLHLIRSIDQFV